MDSAPAANHDIRDARRWRRFGMVLAGVALIAIHATAPVTAASPTACRVRNVTHPESYRSLASAVRAARSRDVLTVRGTCTGRTTIANKRLTITGVRTSTSGPPTLQGNGMGPVVTVVGDRTVVIFKKLAIIGRVGQVLDYDGGGIFNSSSVTKLENVTISGFTSLRKGGGIANTADGTVRLSGASSVRANTARSGGGISSELGGSVVLADDSAVSGNSAWQGGGIDNHGDLTMYGRSSVTGNRADGYGGGGISNGDGLVTLNDSSFVSDNTALIGGGIRNGGGAVTLNDSSAISGNIADQHGGGIETGWGFFSMNGSSSVIGNSAANYGGGVSNGSDGTLTGVRCSPAANANVHDNTPDDCYP